MLLSICDGLVKWSISNKLLSSVGDEYQTNSCFLYVINSEQIPVFLLQMVNIEQILWAINIKQNPVFFQWSIWKKLLSPLSDHYRKILALLKWSISSKFPCSLSDKYQTNSCFLSKIIVFLGKLGLCCVFAPKCYFFILKKKHSRNHFLPEKIYHLYKNTRRIWIRGFLIRLN